MNNNFVAVQVQPSPPEMVGRWTGSVGPYLMTLAINPDGTGMSCYSYGTADVLGRIKYDGAQIQMQDGAKMKAYRSGDQLIATTSYLGSKPMKFIQDNNLASASPFCAKSL
ncbi:hypothetical protein QA447_07200 [Pseudomonas sp. abacavir_1]